VILVGDIGGTRARFALLGPGSTTPVRTDTLESRAFPSLEAAARAFLGPSGPKVHTATLGVAGPVIGNRVTATNLPWIVDADAVARELEIDTVTLLNDLVALSYGALSAPREQLDLLQGDEPPKRKGENLANNGGSSSSSGCACNTTRTEGPFGTYFLLGATALAAHGLLRRKKK